MSASASTDGFTRIVVDRTTVPGKAIVRMLHSNRTSPIELLHGASQVVTDEPLQVDLAIRRCFALVA